MEGPSSCGASRSLFPGLVVLSQALGILSIVLVAAWMGNYRGGFGWKTSLEFSYHPLFMVIGLIFLYGDAIMVYRVFNTSRKSLLKIFHMTLQLCALGFTVFSVIIVFDFHDLMNFPNLYSLHSWVGLCTVVLFGLQFLSGFAAYLYPKCGYNVQASYMPLHRFWGVAIYCLAVATALMGIVEKTLFSIMGTYSSRSPEAYVVNFLGLALIVNGVVVTYLVTRPEYRRRALPDESEEQGLVN